MIAGRLLCLGVLVASGLAALEPATLIERWRLADVAGREAVAEAIRELPAAQLAPFAELDPPPLHAALRSGYEDLALALIGRGIGLQRRDAHERTALHAAVRAGLVAPVRDLLAAGAGLAVLDADDRTALGHAVERGDPAVVAVLLAAGADPLHDRRRDGRAGARSPLEAALRSQQPQAARVLAALLEALAEPAAALQARPVLFGLACRLHHGRRLRELVPHLDPAASLGQEATTWLHLAAREDAALGIDWLHAAGAELDRADRRGRRPLDLAQQGKAYDAMRRLLALGAATDGRDANGNQALHRAARYGDQTAVALLLEAGAAIDAIDRQGQTALMLAAQRGDQGLVDYLLRRGAATTVGEATAVAAAQSGGHPALAAWLRQQGAEGGLPAAELLIHLARSGALDALAARLADPATPSAAKARLLRWGLLKDAYAVVEAALAAGIEPADLDGELPALHLAAAQHRPGLVDRLLAAGAAAGATDRNGRGVLPVVLLARRELVDAVAAGTPLRNRGRDAWQALQDADAVLHRLLVAGARTSLPGLTIAARSGDDRALRLLLPAHGLEPAALVELLQQAVREDHRGVATLLLRAGALLERREETVAALLDRATSEAMRALLRRHGAGSDAAEAGVDDF